MNLDTAFEDMVRALVKPPEQIQSELVPSHCALIHACLGISGEAGEILDAIKKHVIYRKSLDRENLIEELGDMEFYLQDLRNQLEVTREETLMANMNKLRKRYPGFVYTNQRAQERADKQ